MKHLAKALKLVIMLVILSGNFVPLWKTVHADTQERIQVKKIKSLDKIDVNLKNWDDYTEDNKMSLMKNAVTGDAVFCIEPKKEYPSNNSYLTVKSRLENKRIANLILNYQNQKEYISHLDEDAQYAATQCAIFYTVSGDNDDLNVDPVVEKLINYANSLPDPIEQINNFSLKLEPENHVLVKNGDKYTANYSINTEASTLADTQVTIKSNNPEVQSKATYIIKNKQLEISLPAEIVNSTQKKIELEVSLTTKLVGMLQLSGYLAPDQISRQHMAMIQAFQITSNRLYSANAKAEVPEKPSVPEIKTNATNAKDNTKIIPAEEKVQVKDVVTYKNLIPGKEYELNGKLMDKATGKALLIQGKEVTANKKFTPINATGEEDLLFEFNASALHGKKIVVFEELKQEGKQVAVHNDITDINQTVEVPEKPKKPSIPEIKTNATNAKDNTKIIPAEEKVQVKDVVTYKNLIPGKEYELNGKLMDKATGKALLIQGKEVTANKKFTPINATGEEDLLFEFNASALHGKKIVVFEELKQESKQVAVHNDITDINQTVEVPEKPRKSSVPEDPSIPRIPAQKINKGYKNTLLPTTGESKISFFVFLGLFFIALSVILLNYKQLIGKNKK
jgi:LPXTG-motif cell wall-anchored protein